MARQIITFLCIGFIGLISGSTPGVKQQVFRVVPQDVEVVAGDDVTLPCRVDYQRGQAQWTQKGFALGFNRTIPGFPRYTMVGDDQDGVHDLQILNASLVDDGEYQCQVTPMLPSQGIRHSVKITVLLPPTSVEMVDQSDENAKMTVRSGETFTLTCLAKDAKPAPKLEWFRGSQKLRLENQVDTEQSSDRDRRVSLKSQITLSATNSDNNAVYKCRATHPALQPEQDLFASVKLNVLYEPGNPEITGYTDGEIVRAGDKKTLTCRSRGGNPLPEVFWYKNDHQIDTTFNKHQSYTINEHQMTVNASDNNAKYECHVQNLMTTHPKKSEIHMRVNFSPSVVYIDAPDEVNVGDVISITCEARNSNPPADVSLVINGVSPVGLSTRRVKTDDGGFTTFSNLTGYQVAPTQMDLTINCYAVNQPLGDTKLSSKIITVLRPPGPPIIFGYEPGQILRKGENRRLTCQSQGGNPLPNLKWFKGTKQIVTEIIKERGTSTSYLDITLDHTDNGAEYRCEASNSATSTPLSNSTVLIVTYPPVAVKIESSPSTPREGERVLLTCTSTPAFPKANISWWKDAFQQLGEYGPESDGPYMGVITTYSINITATRELNQKIFTCKADNGFRSSTHDAITLQVYFAPEVVTLDRSITVDEGADIEIIAIVEANPRPVNYTWKRGDEVVMTGNVLNITKVTRAIAGTYTLIAENSVGLTRQNVTVDVKFAPVITEVKHRREVAAGSRVSLECHFVGSPSPTVEWQRDEYNFANTETTTFPQKSILTLLNATAADTGFFKCVVTNEVDTASMPNIALVVNQPPVVDPSPKYQKAAADLGGTARLICRVTASPTPTFMWYTKGSEPINADVHTRYEVLPYQLVDDLNTYESVLLVKEVSPKDHGFFTCQIRNSFGLISTPIHLEGTTKPDPPEGLRVLNVTHNSVHVSWEPGFDGGLVQSFRIRYNIPGSKNYLYIDAYPSNATQFWLPGLSLGTSYKITASGLNSKGESNQSVGVLATTLSEAPIGSLSPGVTPEKSRIPGLVIVIITLVGTALLVLNVALVTCFIKKKAEKKRLSASSDKGSSKGTTIEMYAPSSYTGTVTGETLSSISEKSRESYSQEHDSADDYEVDATRIAATSTYLIEQLDPPPQYATRPPPHILPPPTSHNELNMDDPYGENIRRNQYNAVLDRVPGYGTLGRRGNPTLGQDHYNISNADSYPRYNYMAPTANNLPQQSHQANLHSHSHYNGSLRRNPQPKLHFPKDYIRNGAMGSPTGSGTPSLSPTKGAETSFSASLVQSPVRNNNPALSTFSPDVTASTIPIEQRGHLV